jgi:hypothetical protein
MNQFNPVSEVKTINLKNTTPLNNNKSDEYSNINISNNNNNNNYSYNNSKAKTFKDTNNFLNKNNISGLLQANKNENSGTVKINSINESPTKNKTGKAGIYPLNF